jgi:hypothetical protein
MSVAWGMTEMLAAGAVMFFVLLQPSFKALPLFPSWRQHR